MRWLDSIPNSVDVSKFREIVKDRGAWRAAVHGVTKSQTRLKNKSETSTLLLKTHLSAAPGQRGTPLPQHPRVPPQVLSMPSCIITGRQAPH